MTGCDAMRGPVRGDCPSSQQQPRHYRSHRVGCRRYVFIRSSAPSFHRFVGLVVSLGCPRRP